MDILGLVLSQDNAILQAAQMIADHGVDWLRLNELCSFRFLVHATYWSNHSRSILMFAIRASQGLASWCANPLTRICLQHGNK